MTAPIQLGTICIVIAPPGFAFFNQSGAYIGNSGTVIDIPVRPDMVGGIGYRLRFPDGGESIYARPCLVPIAPPKERDAECEVRWLERTVERLKEMIR